MEREYVVKVLSIGFITHNVKRFVLEKPKNYEFIPGQSVYMSINKEGLKDKKRPFTITSLSTEHILEFMIKIYPEHNGVTKELDNLVPGNELIITGPWGDLVYKNKGVFIAGGTGITPFICMFRDLKNKDKLKDNFLIFSNKTWKDIILERELFEMFDEKLILTLSNEKRKGYESGRIDERLLKEHIKEFKQNFYICGPTEFTDSIKNILEKLGSNVNHITF